MSNEPTVPAGWDRAALESHLASPRRGWARDLTSRGLEVAVESDAGPLARQITGQDVDTPAHTAVWLVLALAGLGRTGEPGSGVTLGAYLAGLGRHRGREHYRRIVSYSAGSEPARTVQMVAAVLRGGGRGPAPDPVLLAADLADQLSPDAQVRRRVAMRWASTLAEAGVNAT
ncbi:type I-E CRISPR-associated protein Cse2/CasB [Nocardiopsis changdeensis]|uniref:HEAT repeat domain-containing protein n=1 Tax=Nocardiopsis changdeensis TaxID=2831969 RepID=A0A975QCI3_9ACTN|nr:MULTISPECIES: type I-E CRISPR-associated protein Cse2/CasB [Nocardiopsis]QUX26517.1 hypothetical protein KGD84_32995 [Nocardiopsis changdeensis]QYX40789.1 type I-E CRISPR-associated protein Cse2/CasB [Nocardiopsis sp. MT53]